MKTEKEAKDIRCCGPNGTGEVREVDRMEICNQPRWCIGSVCGGWRWGPRKKKGDPKSDKGYCGVAGPWTGDEE